MKLGKIILTCLIPLAVFADEDRVRVEQQTYSEASEYGMLDNDLARLVKQGGGAPSMNNLSAINGAQNKGLASWSLKVSVETSATKADTSVSSSRGKYRYYGINYDARGSGYTYQPLRRINKNSATSRNGNYYRWESTVGNELSPFSETEAQYNSRMNSNDTMWYTISNSSYNTVTLYNMIRTVRAYRDVNGNFIDDTENDVIYEAIVVEVPIYQYLLGMANGTNYSLDSYGEVDRMNANVSISSGSVNSYGMHRYSYRAGFQSYKPLNEETGEYGWYTTENFSQSMNSSDSFSDSGSGYDYYGRYFTWSTRSGGNSSASVSGVKKYGESNEEPTGSYRWSWYEDGWSESGSGELSYIDLPRYFGGDSEETITPTSKITINTENDSDSWAGGGYSYNYRRVTKYSLSGSAPWEITNSDKNGGWITTSNRSASYSASGGSKTDLKFGYRVTGTPGVRYDVALKTITSRYGSSSESISNSSITGRGDPVLVNLSQSTDSNGNIVYEPQRVITISNIGESKSLSVSVKRQEVFNLSKSTTLINNEKYTNKSNTISYGTTTGRIYVSEVNNSQTVYAPIAERNLHINYKTGVLSNPSLIVTVRGEEYSSSAGTYPSTTTNRIPQSTTNWGADSSRVQHTVYYNPSSKKVAVLLTASGSTQATGVKTERSYNHTKKAYETKETSTSTSYSPNDFDVFSGVSSYSYSRSGEYIGSKVFAAVVGRSNSGGGMGAVTNIKIGKDDADFGTVDLIIEGDCRTDSISLPMKSSNGYDIAYTLERGDAYVEGNNLILGATNNNYIVLNASYGYRAVQISGYVNQTNSVTDIVLNGNVEQNTWYKVEDLVTLPINEVDYNKYINYNSGANSDVRIVDGKIEVKLNEAGTAFISVSYSDQCDVTRIAFHITADKLTDTLIPVTTSCEVSPLRLTVLKESSSLNDYELISGNGYIDNGYLYANAVGNFRVRVTNVGDGNYKAYEPIIMDINIAYLNGNKIKPVLEWGSSDDLWGSTKYLEGNSLLLEGTSSIGGTPMFELIEDVSGTFSLNDRVLTWNGQGMAIVRMYYPEDGCYEAVSKDIILIANKQNQNPVLTHDFNCANNNINLYINSNTTNPILLSIVRDTTKSKANSIVGNVLNWSGEHGEIDILVVQEGDSLYNSEERIYTINLTGNINGTINISDIEIPIRSFKQLLNNMKYETSDSNIKLIDNIIIGEEVGTATLSIEKDGLYCENIVNKDIEVNVVPVIGETNIIEYELALLIDGEGLITIVADPPYLRKLATDNELWSDVILTVTIIDTREIELSDKILTKIYVEDSEGNVVSEFNNEVFSKDDLGEWSYSVVDGNDKFTKSFNLRITDPGDYYWGADYQLNP